MRRSCLLKTHCGSPELINFSSNIYGNVFTDLIFKIQDLHLYHMHFFPLYIFQIVAKVLSSSKIAYSVYLFEWLTAPYEERVAAKKKVFQDILEYSI